MQVTFNVTSLEADCDHAPLLPFDDKPGLDLLKMRRRSAAKR